MRKWIGVASTSVLILSSCTAGSSVADPSGEWLLESGALDGVRSDVVLVIDGSDAEVRTVCGETTGTVVVAGDGSFELTGTGPVDCESEFAAAVHDAVVSAVEGADEFGFLGDRLTLSGGPVDLTFDPVDPSVVAAWDDNARIEVGALTVPVPSEAQRIAYRAGYHDVAVAHGEACLAESADAPGSTEAVRLGCTSLFRWAWTWDEQPTRSDQASMLIWDVEIQRQQCYRNHITEDRVELPPPPMFDEWVADGGAWTAEADLAFSTVDEGEVQAVWTFCSGEAGHRPIPTHEGSIDGASVVEGTLAFEEPACLTLHDADGEVWLPVWPPGHTLLLLPQPGRLLFEVFDAERFDADVAAGAPQDDYTLLGPTLSATLVGSAGPAPEPDFGCTGRPFLVVDADRILPALTTP